MNTKGNRKRRSQWREFEFIFIAIRNAIIPTVELDYIIKNWPRIKGNLAENHRKRCLQIKSLYEIIPNLLS